MSLLHFDGVTRHYGRRAIVQDIDLTVDAGDRVALRGANGTGKTTLLRMAAGTLRPTKGTVQRQGTAAYLAQESPVYRELSVVDHLRFAHRIHGHDWDAAEAIDDMANAGLSRHADRPAGTLSRGQRQRLGALLALRASPDLFILDEPWTALDDAGAAWLTERLDASGASMLVAVHGESPLTTSHTHTLTGGRLQ